MVLLNNGNTPDTPESLAGEITDHVIGNLPAEKDQLTRDMAATARMLEATGSVRSEGLGQRVASIPGRIYHRWNLLYPGCWKDRQFVEEFLWDNPQCRAPGYRPKSHSTRNGITFVGGAAIYHKHKGMVK